MPQDYSFLLDSASMDEFHVQCSLYGIDIEEAIEVLSLASDKGKNCLCLNGKLTWCDDDGSEVDAPAEFNGNFDISGSLTTSLDGCPQVVNGDFNCTATEIQSLRGAPHYVAGNFECSDTDVKSLDGAPVEVVGCVDCFGTNIPDVLIDEYIDFLVDYKYEGDRKKHIDNTGHYRQ